MNAIAIDPARLIRAIALDVTEPTAAGCVVSGGANAHVVRHDGSGWACDCADSAFNPRGLCKHLLARALHQQLDTPILDALRIAVATTT